MWGEPDLASTAVDDAEFGIIAISGCSVNLASSPGHTHLSMLHAEH